jgi:dephospho-CoA kinase
MIIVGLTGSIAMGKSETARMFRAEGVPVFEADAVVHRLYDKGGAGVAAVAEIYPDAVRDGAVDRRALGRLVLGDAEALRRLEAAVHPLVSEERARMLEGCRAEGADLVVLDIPLLFEGGGGEECDRVVVVSAPAALQRQRALARPGMTPETFAAILAQQMPDAEKRRRADFVVYTDKGLEAAHEQVREIIRALRAGS